MYARSVRSRITRRLFGSSAFTSVFRSCEVSVVRRPVQQTTVVSSHAYVWRLSARSPIDGLPVGLPDELVDGPVAMRAACLLPARAEHKGFLLLPRGSDVTDFNPTAGGAVAGRVRGVTMRN